ncbi:MULTISPECIES: glycyl-radical enzyme activating protein [unclassified Lentimicrobium]|uniref:glycyl-radical enzyme activating protein n=1 Tax=unclassified Lentimicrobium TaxID=2677434 RepID=UPI001552F36D|nr:MULTISPECIES: glycyl-radical enzyme activating protein [unclassified Lentimicrobium]NPD44398.1 glycyl-radical enzyme activating protein [Lentimicrobium sp. S6]NPD84336.1 glycyl-radical enzyme activating protein [Lentimicrobium sp. L6]
MRGIVFDIKRFAIHDGPGIRTSIFFKGCPLTCWWCHNPESCATGVQKLDFEFKGSSTLGWETTAEQLLVEVEKDSAFFDESGGGVTFTGGEPMIQAKFLNETAALFKSKELHLTLDTTGYAAEKKFQESADLMDLILFDLKHMNEKAHFEFTGVSNKPILRNLNYLVESGKEVHIRFPMMPGLNDEEKNLIEMMQYLQRNTAIKRIHLLPYHKIASGKYEKLGMKNRMAGIEEPSNARVDLVKDYFEIGGFEVLIG